MKNPVYARTIESATGNTVDTQAALSVGVYRAIGWLENLVADVAHFLVWRRQRARAIRELRALDDRLLADIGIERARIAEVVDSMLTREEGTQRASPDHVTARGVHLGA